MITFERQTKRSLLLTALIVISILPVQADGIRCSDLSEHESVLNEGQSSLHSGESADSSMTPLDLRPGETFFSEELGERTLLSNLFSDKQINLLRLSTASEINDAEWHARICEMAGRWGSARQIYLKVLMAKRSTNASKGEVAQTSKDLERVDIAMKIKALEGTLQYYEAAGTFRRLTTAIIEDDHLDVRTRYQLLKSVIVWMSSNFVIVRIPVTKFTLADATSQMRSYEKSLQCLDLADQLNAVGFKLEQQGLYSKAQKMYNEALIIRTKNLGATAPATIAEYGELARLQAAQKHYTEAISLYERSLADYRKLPAPGSEYGAMLQSYGDLLAQLKQKAKSDAIYAEARNFYRRSTKTKL